jgi:CubicO group peptidase (beta-lactamase class C family)
VITRRDEVAAVPGRFGWEGGFGTAWFSDPTEELVAILMSQRLPPAEGLFNDFSTGVYQAIED